MSLLQNIAAGLHKLFHVEQFNRDLDEELSSYIEASAAERMKAGMGREEAFRTARLEFRGVEGVKEEVRATGWEHALETFWQDLRFGIRMLRKNPGFTVVAVLTLALGIGATVAIFTVVNAVLIRPLPFKDSSGLMILWEGLPKMGAPKIGFSAPDLAYFESSQKTFEAIGAFQNKEFDISGRAQPERIMAARVSAAVFRMLGEEPILGRTFTSEEDRPGHNAALLSYGLWKRRYAGDKDIVGQTIDLDKDPYTVVGVMPSNFSFPLSGLAWNDRPADLWVPMAFTAAELQGWGAGYNNDVVARLKPGVSVDQARQEALAASKMLMGIYPPAFLKASQRRTDGS